jgi:hypothetical protein
MCCLKLPVVAAVLLSLLANAQCVARCAATHCGQPTSSADLPPCHRHQSPAPKPCTAPLFVADKRPHSAPKLTLQAIVADTEPVAAPMVWQPASHLHPPSPPLDSGSSSITILRI